MISFRRRDDPYALVTGMAGVKMGDRVVQIGCAHAGRLGAVMSKVGLSGRAVALVADEPAAARARKGAADAGVLVDVEIAPLSPLPVEDGAFDLALIDDTAGLLAALSEDQRAALGRELFRILRPGGRGMVIGAVPRTGLSAVFTNSRVAATFDATPMLASDGFKSVRVLAERDGLRFVEGVKPRGGR
jgi:SAM-dependent methyltransferase